jgi:hypothetical protein
VSPGKGCTQLEQVREQSKAMEPRIHVWSAAFPVNAMLDDGADVTIVNFYYASSVLGLKVEASNTKTIQFAQGEAEVDGECWIELTYLGGRCSVRALVLRDAGENLLLGRDFLLLANIDCRLNRQGWCYSDQPNVIYPFAPVLSSSDRTRCNWVTCKQTEEQDMALPSEFQRDMLEVEDGFDTKGWLETPQEGILVQHEIALKPGSRPFMAKPRRIGVAKSVAFVKDIDKWQEQGTIKRADSPWKSPPVVMMEKPGSLTDKVRACLGHQRWNEMSKLVPMEVDRAEVMIIQWRRPRLITDATSGQSLQFVGILVMIFRKGIPLFWHLVRTLRSQVEKDQEWKWQDEEQLTFAFLGQTLLSHEVLMLPDWSNPFQIEPDAHCSGLGEVLLQEEVNGMRSIRFAFHTLLSEVTPATVDRQVGERARELRELLQNLADSEVYPTQECSGYPEQAHGRLPEQTPRRCGDYIRLTEWLLIYDWVHDGSPPPHRILLSSGVSFKLLNEGPLYLADKVGRTQAKADSSFLSTLSALLRSILQYRRNRFFGRLTPFFLGHSFCLCQPIQRTGGRVRRK